jgi:hypothetical protein
MNFNQFAQGLGTILGAVINQAVSEHNAQSSRQHAMSAEQMEADKWEKRRLQALADIDQALEKDEGIVRFNGMTRKGEDALNLRHEVNTHCRNRSEPLMAYAERRILELRKRTW